MPSFVLANGERVAYRRKGTFKVDVNDDGVGMSEEQLAKLFGVGVQFNVNNLQAGQGSGLGLYIARGIMHQHDGDLTASSEGIGKGATFTMTLPVYEVPDHVTPEHDQNVAVPSTIPPLLLSSSSLMNRKIESDLYSTSTVPVKFPISLPEPSKIRRILVVDDSNMNRKLLVRLLQKQGYQCDEAENGQVAIEKVQHSLDEKNPYHTILLDFEMPVKNGPDACLELRGTLGCQSIIIGLTGNVMAEDVQLFKSRGANDVLAKPFKLEELNNAWASISESMTTSSS
jgi:CheY-like chemotaxis protein